MKTNIHHFRVIKKKKQWTKLIFRNLWNAKLRFSLVSPDCPRLSRSEDLYFTADLRNTHHWHPPLFHSLSLSLSLSLSVAIQSCFIRFLNEKSDYHVHASVSVSVSFSFPPPSLSFFYTNEPFDSSFNCLIVHEMSWQIERQKRNETKEQKQRKTANKKIIERIEKRSPSRVFSRNNKNEE